MILERHKTIDEPNQTAIVALSSLVPQISIQKLKRAMLYGAVWLTRGNTTARLRRAKRTLYIGDKLHLYYNESVLLPAITPAQLVADEGEYSVWNKPCGMFSQGTKWGDHTAIARWVELFGLTDKNLTQRPAFLVHRLDRATSGLILIAHSKKMATQLSALFENREIIKKYRATVEGVFPSEMIGKTINMPVDGKDALSLIESVEYDAQKSRSTLLIQIKTGRKHQIRVHLSQFGFPVVGDRLYGSKEEGNENMPDLMLQSCYLAFCYPIDLDSLERKYVLSSIMPPGV